MALRYKLFPKALGTATVGTATVLDWWIPVSIDGMLKTRYEHFKGTKPNFVNHESLADLGRGRYAETTYEVNAKNHGQRSRVYASWSRA